MITVGAVRPEDNPALYGLEGLDPEQRRRRMALIDAHVPSGRLCIGVGDVLCTDGLHTLYRASTVEGMSGSAVRVLDSPSLMCAVHLAGSRKSGPGSEYNVGLSVNHPVFVRMYVRYVLPKLALVPASSWPRDYMRPALAAWLRHHAALLAAEGLYTDSMRSFLTDLGWPCNLQ